MDKSNYVCDSCQLKEHCYLPEKLTENTLIKNGVSYKDICKLYKSLEDKFKEIFNID